MTFKIYWTNSETGQEGTTGKKFDEDTAKALVEELNADYPGFNHEARPVRSE
jgi:hypothetical protein